MCRIILISVLFVFQVNGIFSQKKEVITIAKQFCHATNDFFYFTNDETLKTRAAIELSKIFDYQEGTYFVSAGIKTIMILPVDSLDYSLQRAASYFEKSGEYTFAVRGKSRSMMKEGRAVYRFYPYKNAIIFEIFD